MLPCEGVIATEMGTIDLMVLLRQITYLEGVARRVVLLDLMSDAGLIPDEPKEAR